MNSSMAPRFSSANALRPGCSTCSLADLCLPLGLPEFAINKLDALIDQRQRIARGSYLYRAGESFHAIYAIKCGSFKTHVISEDGREQVTGFHMTGEILGIDAISTDSYHCHATALEDSEVCVIPFAHLENLIREVPSLQRNLHRIMSREIVRDQNVMMLLGNMRAEERLAAFLLNLSQRHAARGHSASSFHLRMTRAEIGSFMGMKIETVSRTFTKLQDEGYLGVDHRLVTIKRMDDLKQLVGNSASYQRH